MKINSDNEWDPLKEVILGSMDGYFPGLEFTKNFKFRNFDKVLKIALSAYPKSYVEEVNEDLDDLKNFFLKNNIKVFRPKKYNSDKIFSTPYWSAIGCDSYNVRDLHIVVGNKIICSPSPVKYRFFESYNLHDVFLKYFKNGFEWISAPNNKLNGKYLIPFKEKKLIYSKEDLIQKNIMNGRKEKFHKLDEKEIMFDAASTIRMGKDLVYLISNTGNYQGAKWLQMILGCEYKVHPVTSYRASHIDSTILPLNSRTVLINSVRVPKSRVPKVFSKWKKIFHSEMAEVPASELSFQEKYRDVAFKKLKDLGVNSYLRSISSPWAGLNVLSINPNTVLVEMRQDKLIKKLENEKFNVIPVSMRHMYTMLGGLHCSTLDTVRKS
jgi:N-dimethylarginine dimethylaminohydrolase